MGSWSWSLASPAHQKTGASPQVALEDAVIRSEQSLSQPLPPFPGPLHCRDDYASQMYMREFSRLQPEEKETVSAAECLLLLG